MKAGKLAVSRYYSWRNIATTLIDPANRLVSAQGGRTDGASLC